jgi:hypothetical protein
MPEEERWTRLREIHDCQSHGGAWAGKQLPGSRQVRQNSALEQVVYQSTRNRDVATSCLPIGALRFRPILNASPKAGQVLRMDTHVGVAAQVQNDGTVFELAGVGMSAEEAR